MSYQVLLVQPMDQCGIDYLLQRGCCVEVCTNDSPDYLRSKLAQCDGVISKTLFLPEELIRNCPRLRVIVKHGVGIDNIVDIKVAERLGIRVCNTPHANTNSVAEFVFGLLIACAKRLREMMSLAASTDVPDPTPLAGTDLSGKALGILGIGNIGLALAKKAYYGLDMRILGYSRNNKPVQDYIQYADSLRDLFSRSDFISVNVPLTPETAGLVSQELLYSMKPTAYFINTSRGSVVDERALYNALEEKRIAGAALDVWENNRIKADMLKHLPNVIITPHSAAISREALKRMSIDSAIAMWSALNGDL